MFDISAAGPTALPADPGTSFSPFNFTPPPYLSESAAASASHPFGIAPTPPSNPQYAAFPFDTTPHAAAPPQATAAATGGTGTGPALTPDAQSQVSGHTDSGTSEKDPFLSLLEQLAENENSRGGPSELDFFLGAPDESGIVPDEE